MHLRGSWLVVCLLVALAARAAVIYKWTDAEGVVHFSDQPVPGAEKIITSGKPLNGYSAPPATPGGNGPPVRAPGAEPRRSAALTIISPQPDQSFFNNEQINVALSQDLNPSQSVSWHLNGMELTDQPPTAAQFTLTNPGRGTFAIAATITDQMTGDVQSTPSVTFYVHEPSLLSPQHRNP